MTMVMLEKLVAELIALIRRSGLPALPAVLAAILTFSFLQYALDFGPNYTVTVRDLGEYGYQYAVLSLIALWAISMVPIILNIKRLKFDRTRNEIKASLQKLLKKNKVGKESGKQISVLQTFFNSNPISPNDDIFLSDDSIRKSIEDGYLKVYRFFTPVLARQIHFAIASADAGMEVWISNAKTSELPLIQTNYTLIDDSCIVSFSAEDDSDQNIEGGTGKAFGVSYTHKEACDRVLNHIVNVYQLNRGSGESDLAAPGTNSTYMLNGSNADTLKEAIWNQSRLDYVKGIAHAIYYELISGHAHEVLFQEPGFSFKDNCSFFGIVGSVAKDETPNDLDLMFVFQEKKFVSEIQETIRRISKRYSIPGVVTFYDNFSSIPIKRHIGDDCMEVQVLIYTKESLLSKSIAYVYNDRHRFNIAIHGKLDSSPDEKWLSFSVRDLIEGMHGLENTIAYISRNRVKGYEWVAGETKGSTLEIEPDIYYDQYLRYFYKWFTINLSRASDKEKFGIHATRDDWNTATTEFWNSEMLPIVTGIVKGEIQPSSMRQLLLEDLNEVQERIRKAYSVE